MSVPNLRDVAKQAGVAVSTASRVLNNADTLVAISEATRTKVLEAAKRIGYVPSAAARALRIGSTRAIGVLGDSPQELLQAVGQKGFNVELMRGLLTQAVDERLHLLLLTGMPNDVGAYNSRVAELGMADGLLVVNRDLARGGSCIEAIERLDKPLVYVLEYPEGKDVHVCAPDDAQGGRLATEKLLEAGHRRIGFLTEPNYYPGVFGRRRAGWETALLSAGVTPEPGWVIGHSSVERVDIEAEGLTAVVSPNDWMANTLRARITKELGLSVPEDISIVTFAYDVAGTNESPVLASVTTSLAPIVSRGVSMLSALIAGASLAERRFAPEFEYVPGQSVTTRRDQKGERS